MRKYYLFILFPILLLACQMGNKKETSGQKAVLTVTIEPQRYFLEQIVGDAFKINTLVPPGTSPETYEPAPSVMVEMGNSLIYFMVGDLGFEKAWSKRLAANNPNITLVECATGIERVELGNHVEHGHDHIHGDTDPHFWSSPRAVKIMTANMLEAVVKADPANEEIYRTNFDRFARQLDETDSLIQDKLAHVTSRGFIIYHPALAYFAKDYNLYQHSVEFQGKNPSPSQIKALVDLARREQINTLFIQKGFDAKNMEVIAREIGAEVFEIDPLNYEWDKELLRLVDILARDVDE
ncbi:MAG: zinc ABC transporter substrate-binding protein [Proteiniphilum sp.]|jgi:zinc transport system substrate-binding protein|nr:zinc ABC transporter substrate-binding protein [Proteiniphilum sp.]NCB24711.1 zinc ABC transporter substrate-binding protein [Bacteroidia bacterium]MDD2937167.1 zinc ABC transporter substrate-binding protein [Proteiniphilum sp.]MDD3076766.1 zinc ABC transporter substrate-binding protein [Proteiniphilum sp.]MDD3956615.1 zinc ABC transporter substrate-binding protein [Proteiniphilum sp.]